MKLLNLILSICLLASFSSCQSPTKPEPFVKGEFKTWAQTPPMGWNSWDCYGPTVEEHEVKANADYMADKLKDFGWEYIVVDIRWFVENDKAGGYNQTDPRYVIDEYGRYQPAVNRFPSAADGKGFKELADYIHSKGLKFGIHIMRGIPKVAVEQKLPIKGTDGITADQIYSTELQCQWLRDNYTIVADKPGAQEYYNSLFDLYADWEIDFIKIDDLSRPYHQAEIELIRKAIDQCGRPIVLSTSPGETPIEAADHVREHANMWRMVDDVWDTWNHITHLMDISRKWYPYIAPGTWPDCDMIPLGRISIRGERGEDRMSRLTGDEQYSLMTLFTIFKSPLMFGGDLPSNDDFTLSLLTNQEVLRMHRESVDVRQLFREDGKVGIVSKNPNSGEIYLALFNISDNEEPLDLSVDLTELGFDTECTVTDMWSGEVLGTVSGIFSHSLAAHACGLFKLNQ
ncbi:glycoside hydrolase family 27 protein [Gaoshiqia sp. Z1-71]|uniref:glycoside hydrolase family 27 protein n=1 Tax=Gaoshiqia hydrogeniformans TaxID=3290090 RepID=UPI003BF834A6